LWSISSTSECRRPPPQLDTPPRTDSQLNKSTQQCCAAAQDGPAVGWHGRQSVAQWYWGPHVNVNVKFTLCTAARCQSPGADAHGGDLGESTDMASVATASTRTHTHTQTHDEKGKQEQSKKSGERKLLRDSRAVLDVFRSVRKRGNVLHGMVSYQAPAPSPALTIVQCS
jgi:hypothetical protein